MLERCIEIIQGPWARDAAEQFARIARARGDRHAEMDALEVARRAGTGSGSEWYDHVAALAASTTELADILVARGAQGRCRTSR